MGNGLGEELVLRSLVLLFVPPPPAPALCPGRLTGKSLLLSGFWLGLLVEVGGREESKVGS